MNLEARFGNCVIKVDTPTWREELQERWARQDVFSFIEKVARIMAPGKPVTVKEKGGKDGGKKRGV